MNFFKTIQIVTVFHLLRYPAKIIKRYLVIF